MKRTLERELKYPKIISQEGGCAGCSLYDCSLVNEYSNAISISSLRCIIFSSASYERAAARGRKVSVSKR